MENIVNVAFQVLPTSEAKHPYSLVDEAINVIQKSGLKFQVTPFETVIEGKYNDVMKIIKEAQEACYRAGADSLMAYIKIQSSRKDVSIKDKMEKYS